MNRLKIILLLLVLGLSTTLIISCGAGNTADKNSKAYTAAYICPMHCDGSGAGFLNFAIFAIPINTINPM